MGKFLNALQLRKEAVLLDSKPFIAKTFFAIATAYVLGSSHPIASKDMISVLFGLILTLEPVNVTGVRRGWEQFVATFTGAVTTAIIISIFGINPITAGASVALTLYVCLKVNWRQISPVALFTAIYMTQYIQLDAMGNPSVLLTFRLRIIALGFGVFTAIAFNFLFSMIQYRNMGNRRVIFLMKRLLNHMNTLELAMRSGDAGGFRKCQMELVSIFNDIDSTTSLFEDMLKENASVRKLMGVTDDRLRAKLAVTRKLRVFCHLLFDSQYLLTENASLLSQSEIRLAIADSLHALMDQLGSLKDLAEGRSQAVKSIKLDLPQDVASANLNRIMNNLREMNVVLGRVHVNLNTIASLIKK
tara:strand:- start:392 stop:1468 length:1077 start_codon:yes stop_codon:yes gene_type:complete